MENYINIILLNYKKARGNGEKWWENEKRLQKFPAHGVILIAWFFYNIIFTTSTVGYAAADDDGKWMMDMTVPVSEGVVKG